MKPPNDMVEKVARAIYYASDFGRPIGGDPFATDTNGAAFARGMARAAIKAMREPTYKMLRAGKKMPITGLRPGTADCDVNAIADRPEDGSPNGGTTRLRYQAMIDAALEE